MTVTDRRQPPVGQRRLESLADRVGALRRFVDAAWPHVPESTVAPAWTIVDRAGERLALSRDHTVVALVGATGSGKSSLFNRLADVDLSTVGRRRPTTGHAHACVWGSDRADELLDWLGVPASRRFAPRAPADGDLAGLVLLDLPDFDSVEAAHRIEVDRLLALVDLMVWVLDPQKYADRVVHKQYLSQFSRHRDVTVVVLNQADLLGPVDTDRCLDDLLGLLGADGLGGVPVLATSAVGPPGLGPLPERLRRAVAARQAVLRRLSADVDGVVAGLAPVVAAEPARDAVDRAAARALTDALARAAGVPVVADATRRAYIHRAVRSTGWPVLRWLRRLRPDPLSRLRLGPRSTGAGEPGPVAATSIPPAAPAARAAMGLALRTLGERAGDRLPAPWPAAVSTAARSHVDDLPDALDVAIATTDLGMSRRPVWWRLIGGLHWLLAVVGVLGLIWLLVRYALFVVALPDLPAPSVGRIPVPTLMLAGGLLGGLLLAAVARPVVRIAARRKANRAARRMRAAVERVGEEKVLDPVRAVVRGYAEARAALRAASAHRSFQDPVDHEVGVTDRRRS
jgi:hypothetical protein